MNESASLISVHSSCNEVLPRVQRSLENAGLRAIETFDLQAARSSWADCTCPHHGAVPCDCQLVVLIVYGEATAPIALMLHGTDGHTWISFPGSLNGESELLAEKAIEAAIRHLQTAEGL